MLLFVFCLRCQRGRGRGRSRPRPSNLSHTETVSSEEGSKTPSRSPTPREISPRKASPRAFKSPRTSGSPEATRSPHPPCTRTSVSPSSLAVVAGFSFGPWVPSTGQTSAPGAWYAATSWWSKSTDFWPGIGLQLTMDIAPVVSPLAQTLRHRLLNCLSILALHSLTTILPPLRPYILRQTTIGNTASMVVELPRLKSLIFMWSFCSLCFLRLCYALRFSVSPFSRFYPFTRLGFFALCLPSDRKMALCSRFAPVIISVSPAFINVQRRLSRYLS